MFNIKSILVAGVCATAMMGLAAAGSNKIGTIDSIANLQWNFNTVFTDVELYAEWVQGDLRASSQAVGNNLSIETDDQTRFWNRQYQMADVGASIKATAIGVGGNASFEATGICNNASLDQDGHNRLDAGNDQRCQTLDPYAIVNVNAIGVGGNLDISAAAVANNFTLNSGASVAYVDNFQVNPAAVNANIVSNISDVGGNITVSATAIGNNASINLRGY
jgi:hypothetical protein